MKKRLSVQKLVYAALCLALAIVLPFLTGQIKDFSKIFSPMHLPVMLCGLLCSWQYGLAVGLIAPILRSLCFGMPVMFPDAVCMAAELGTYGLITGLGRKILPKKIGYTYITLVFAMLCGRLILCLAKLAVAGLTDGSFALAMFWSSSVLKTVPGMILQLVLLPLILLALDKAGLTPKD